MTKRMLFFALIVTILFALVAPVFAQDPVAMARAFGAAVGAGRLAHEIGLPESHVSASPTSPLTAFLSSGD